MAQFPTTLAGWRDILLPGLSNVLQDAAPTIKRVDLWADMADNSLSLVVTHHLFRRDELDDKSRIPTMFRERVYQILQVKKKTPKQITVERRRMLWRGECARKAKAKKK